MDLDEIRQNINKIDRGILNLLAKRHQVAFEVIKTKEKTNKPIRDLQREHDLINALIDEAQQQNYDLNNDYIRSIFAQIINESVMTQQDYLQQKLNFNKEQLTIAFLGKHGSYSHLASLNFAQKFSQKVIEKNCSSFTEVFAEVGQSADFGVLPIENTTSGAINEVYDLLQNTSLHVVGELTYPIEHCILSKTNVKRSEITTLYSHPQVFSQCSNFIAKLKNVKINFTESTSHAMELVAKSNDPSVAALGNAKGGGFYDLMVLENDIANQKDNITRFIVIAKNQLKISPKVATKTLIVMTTAQKAGSLVDALMIMKKHNIIMRKLESRPIYGKPWQEMFYVEMDLNLESSNARDFLDDLKGHCNYLRVLGCYPSHDRVQL